MGGTAERQITVDYIALLLRDPMWQSFGALIGLRALFLMIRGRGKTELRYAEASVALINLKESFDALKKVEVRVDDQIIENPYLTSIYISNTGNRKITEENIRSPIKVDLGEKIKILSR